jgi:hypothetical protein
MRRTFEPIDDLLIERFFQPLSDMIAHRTGLSRPAASCFCIDMASLTWIVSRLRGLSDMIARWNPASASLDVIILMLGLVALMCLRTLFRRAGNKQANPLRPAMQPHRAVALLMIAARMAQSQAPTLMEAADLSMLLFAVSALYLGACAERPPVRRDFAPRHAPVDVAVSP